MGLAYQLDAATLEAYRGYGIDLEAASGRDHHSLPVPAMLVYDPRGVLRFSYVNPDHTVRLPIDVLLAIRKEVARLTEITVRTAMANRRGWGDYRRLKTAASRWLNL